MNLVGIAASAANIAFTQAGNAKESAVIHGPSQPGDYDPATDTTSASSASDKTVEGVFYHSYQQQQEATGNQALFTFEGVDAPTVLDESCTVTIKGALWNIAMVETIPTNAVITLHLQK